MTRRLLAALAIAAAVLPTWAATAMTGSSSPNVRSHAVSHAGRWIVEADGRVAIDHGFNVVSKVAPFDPAAAGFGADDARFLARHGFTAVRLGVLLERLEPAPGKYNDRYLTHIASTVHLLGRYGIRSLLDFHQDLFTEKYDGEGLPGWMAYDDGIPAEPHAGFPGNYFAMPALWRAFDNFWTDAKGPDGVGVRERFAQAWAHVARHFRGDAAVLGYDVFNEPFPGSYYLSCFPPRGCPEQDTALLVPFMSQVIKAIHRVDPGHLAFYEPWLTFDYGAPTALGDFADGNSGLSFHDYCLATVGAPETPPTRTVCTDLVESRVVTHALAQANDAKDALLLTEFGATSDVTELHVILDLMDAHSIPWMDWAYCACGDPTGNGEAESLVFDPRKPPVGKNVNRPVLGVLDEPHPMLVAGTPGAFSYDADRRLFDLHYSTQPAGRVAPARNLPTRIWVGSMHYPHGYTAFVRGGRITSAPDAAVLTVVASPGAHDVHVVVGPR